MKPIEQSAISHLLKRVVEDDAGMASDDESDGETELDESEQARKSRKLQQSGNGISYYINLDFILGSAAEFERLWSMASHVLLKNRQAMTPIAFEAIVF